MNDSACSLFCSYRRFMAAIDETEPMILVMHGPVNRDVGVQLLFAVVDWNGVAPANNVLGRDMSRFRTLLSTLVEVRAPRSCV